MEHDTATLEAQLEQESFAPPRSFSEAAVVSDASIYERAEADFEGFWTERAEALHWDRQWDQVLDWSNPPFAKWFVGGKLNASYNCLDRHVERGLGGRVAFHWRGEEGEERDVTYADLLRDVQRFANALRMRSIGAGDVVAIFLPMIPEVVVAMLACARIGAIHGVVFGGFSAESVRERLEFSEAKALITVDGARRKGRTARVKHQVDEVVGDLKALQTVFVVRHAGIDAPTHHDRDLFFDESMAAADPECPPEPLDAEHPLFMLYTSGSTAKPKGIVHTTGGYLTGVAFTHIDVSGHRLSTAEVESAIVSHETVAESAVIGQADDDTGQSITAFVMLQGDLEGDDALIAAIREHAAIRIGKLARPKRIIWADDLPKTRSGKIVRRLLRDVAEGRELGDVTTLRDPEVMRQLAGRIAERGDDGD